MAPSHYSSESGFDSDDDAPEAISTSTAKQQITKAEQANLERERRSVKTVHGATRTAFTNLCF